MAFKFEQDEGTKDQYLVFPNPSAKLPYNIDFETFRKTDEDWKKVIEWHDGGGGSDLRGDVNDKSDGSDKKETPPWKKERFVLFRWPRDPDGPILRDTESGKGKETPNGGELWGATLYDFYHVARMPSQPSLITISTGSKLAAWCKQKGELDWAKEPLRRAEMEEEPRQIHVFDIGQYLEILEDQVWKGKVGKPMEIDRSDTNQGTHTLYAPCEYPVPWPLRPFSAPLARLQCKFPHSALPRKLVVHDPWNTLQTTTEDCNYERYEENCRACKWGMKPDIVRTYRLKLASDTEESPEAKKDGESQQNKEPEVEKKGDQEPECPVAHLYISPIRLIGMGHHSFVYQVELELPREMLVQPKACWECSLSKYHLAKAVYEDEGVMVDRDKEVIKEAIREVGENDFKEYFLQACEFGKRFADETPNTSKYAFLNECISWQAKPPYCAHISSRYGLIPVPPSHRVSVTAKLCIPPDTYEYSKDHLDQLLREAQFYQKFPNHLFEHWNGYNIIPPVHDPTPIGAVVPQFYGYYVPDEKVKNEGADGTKVDVFMSPILLLEHCGEQVDPGRMSLDDRQECLSLLRRLHLAGYTHGSIFQRNFLMQHGPLQYSPFKRSRLHPRFRLIDLGRTGDYTDKPTDDRKAFLDMSVEVTAANENLRLELY